MASFHDIEPLGPRFSRGRSKAVVEEGFDCLTLRIGMRWDEANKSALMDESGSLILRQGNYAHFSDLRYLMDVVISIGNKDVSQHTKIFFRSQSLHGSSQ